MAQISKRVRDAVSTRLAAAWSTKLAAALPDYAEVTAADGTALAGIDWAGAQRYLQVIVGGPVEWDSLDGSGTLRYPAVQIYTIDAQHDGEEKFVLFSGTVQVVVEFAWSWRQGSAVPDFATVPDLIEDVLVEILHEHAWVGALGAAGLSYRGEMQIGRSPVVMAAEHWRQVITVNMRIGIDV